MLIDLNLAFENYIKNTLPEVGSGNSSIKDSFWQLVLFMKKDPSVKIVSDISTLIVTDNYNNLPILELTGEEKEIVDKNIINLQKNPNFYDGKHIVITNASYDNENNIIYIEAKQVSYSTLSALKEELFAQNSPVRQKKIYETGVIAPFITNDNYTVILERRDRLYSAAAGFCEPNKDNILGAPEYGLDLFKFTAIIESIEEILGEAEEAYKFREFIDNKVNREGKDFIQKLQNFSKVKFSLPIFSGISIHESSHNIPSMDFIFPIFLECSRKELEEVINNCSAKDFHEHSGKYSFVPLNKQYEIISFLEEKKPGSMLYFPILFNAIKLIDTSFDPKIYSYLSDNKLLAIDIGNITSELNLTASIKD